MGIRSPSAVASLLLAWAGVASALPLCDPNALGLQALATTTSDDEGCVSGGDSSSPVVNQASFQAAGGQAGHSFAMTSYGINAASVTGNLPTDISGATAASAWSIWADTLWITGGTGSDVVVFSAHISGSMTDHTSVGLTLSINDGAGGNFSNFQAGVNPNPGVTTYFSEDLLLYYTFTYDVPFDLSAWLNVSGNLDSSCCGGPGAQPPFAADFSHTAAIDKVILPSGASLSSLSGTSYPVREPGWVFGDNFEQNNLLGWSTTPP